MSAPFCERAGSNVAVFLRTHSVFLRTHSVFLRTHYVFLPTHSVFMRTHSVFLRTHSVFLRTHSVFLRTHSVFLRTHSVFMRTHSVFLPTHSVFLPTHSVFMRTQYVFLRTHSVFLRTHSVFLRTHSVHNPIAPNLWWCFTAELSCSELQSRYNPSTLFRCCVWLRGRRTHTSSRRPAARSGTRAPRKRSCAQSAASSPTCTVSGGGNFHSKWEETSRCFCWKRCHQQPWFLSWQCCNRIVATQLSVVSLHRSNAHGSRLCWRCNGFALSASSALRPVPV